MCALEIDKPFSKCGYEHIFCGSMSQAAPDVRIGGGQRWRAPKKSEQISELGGYGGMPPGIFFLIVQNAANWAIFSFFVRPLCRK